MKKYFAYLFGSLLLFSIHSNLLAQSSDVSVTAADQLFAQKRYAEAARIYEQLLDKESAKSEYRIRLAESYYFSYDFTNALERLRYVIEKGINEPIHTYYYAMCLKEKGKYIESYRFLKAYQKEQSFDSRAAKQMEACALQQYHDYYTTNSGVFKVKKSKLLVDGPSSNPVVFDEGIVFVNSANHLLQADRSNEAQANPELLYVFDPSNQDYEPEEPLIFLRENKNWLYEGSVAFSPNKQEMYVTQAAITKGKKGATDIGQMMIYKYVRSGKSWKLESDKPLGFCKSDYMTGQPVLSPNGQAMYFVSDMPGSLGGTDIFVSYRSGKVWGPPENLGDKINTEGNEMYPFLAHDGTLYFTSDGHAGMGGLDIFYAQETDDNHWNDAVNLRAPVNSPADDYALQWNNSGTEGFFVTNNKSGEYGERTSPKIHSIKRLSADPTDFDKPNVSEALAQIESEAKNLQVAVGAPIVQKEVQVKNPELPIINLQLLQDTVYQDTITIIAIIQSPTALKSYNIVQVNMEGNTKGGVNKPFKKTKNTVWIKQKMFLKPGVNHFYISATNEHGTNHSETMQLVYRELNQIDIPRLFVLSVGVSKFKNEGFRYNLDYADNDAQDFANLFQTLDQKQVHLPVDKRLFKEIQIHTLIDEQAVKDSIEIKVLDIKDMVNKNDLVLVFLSSHGHQSANDYYIRTHDTRAEAKYLSYSAVQASWLSREFDSFGCTVVQFFDACHSGRAGTEFAKMKGNVDVARDALKTALDPESTYIFSSSSGVQLSQENPKWENGAFTEAIVSCMKGQDFEVGKKVVAKADPDGDGVIYTNELADYIYSVVTALTENQQKPEATIVSGKRLPLYILE